MKIALHTSGAGDLVHTQEIPPFNQAPDVIFWGTRVFKYYTLHRHDGQIEHQYKEAFAYTIVEVSKP